MSFYSPLVAALTCMLLISRILSSRFGEKMRDVPNERSLHVTPVPRIGGAGIVAGLLAGWALMPSALKWWTVLPLIGLFIVSLLDDMRNLSVRTRLSAHIAAAAILVIGSGIYAQQGMLGGLAVLLLTVWMTNLYNFMDGSDGLAGGMAFFGFGMYGTAALMAHDGVQATLNLTICAAALGFLYSNFHPAKIFMGDAGSIPLGFLAAAMGVSGYLHGAWPAWFPPLVFSPFVVDASVTLVKRTWQNKKITEAHREHYYQRLVQMGWGHRNIALIEYVMMLGVGITALTQVHQTFPWQAFLIWGGIYAALMLAVDAAWNRFRRAHPHA